jgi:DUF4097 and DUF4098 domain-containing protein YvlB
MTSEHVEEIEKSLSFEGVELVRLRNVNGGVRITSWEKPEVFVKATKKVRASSDEKAKEYAQEVKIRIEKVGDTIEIITEHPKAHKPRFIGGVSVEYDVTMPKKANLDAKSTNGSMNVAGIVGETSAETTNGSVSIGDCEGKIILKTTNGRMDIEEVSGSVGAKTSNGKISAKLAMLDGESGFETTNGSIDVRIQEGHAVPLTANTTNGSITVELPSDFAADLEANTSNGHIRSDLPITVAGEISKTSLHGELNGGGPLMKLKTTNGNINIDSPTF